MKILLPLIVLCLTIFLLQREPLALSEGAGQETIQLEATPDLQQVQALPARLLQEKYTELTGRINDLILFNQ